MNILIHTTKVPILLRHRIIVNGKNTFLILRIKIQFSSMQSLMNAINVLVMKSLKAARSVKNANIVQGSFIFLYYYYLKEYIVFRTRKNTQKF